MIKERKKQKESRKSSLKKKHKLQKPSFLDREHQKQNKKLSNALLSKYCTLDYAAQIRPKKLSYCEVQTYGCLNQEEITQVFRKSISKELLKELTIDVMKLCYLHGPIEQSLYQLFGPKKEQFQGIEVLELIIRGKFYQHLKFKTIQPKFLINNRSTEVNVRVLLSGLITLLAGKLTLKQLSDILLFYRLEEALYNTAPLGIPFDFDKILKTIKKLDRTITAKKFSFWQTRMKEVESEVKFLQAYHFIYLLSLAEPISRKKNNLFSIARTSSQHKGSSSKHDDILFLLDKQNQKSFFQQRKNNWKNNIKVRGLSFLAPKKIQDSKVKEKQFQEVRRKIKSHKRIKSAYICGQAKKSVKDDLRKGELTDNEYWLDICFYKPEPQERKLLKKHYQQSQKRQQQIKAKQKTKKQFQDFYDHTYSHYRQNSDIQQYFPNKKSRIGQFKQAYLNVEGSSVWSEQQEGENKVQDSKMNIVQKRIQVVL